MDACFSGGTNAGKWLISGASPALLETITPVLNNENMVVLTSAKSDQISSCYDDKKHGLFTYFFLKAICGAGDIDKNNQLTFQEIFDYISDRSEGIPYWARRLHGRMQTPVLHGIGSNIFVVY